MKYIDIFLENFNDFVKIVTFEYKLLQKINYFYLFFKLNFPKIRKLLSKNFISWVRNPQCGLIIIKPSVQNSQTASSFTAGVTF